MQLWYICNHYLLPVPVSVLTLVPKMLNTQLKMIEKFSCALFLKCIHVSDEVIDREVDILLLVLYNVSNLNLI